MCWYATQNEPLTFATIADGLLPKLLADTQLLPAILETLGTPASSAFLNPFRSIEEAAVAGSRWAGARAAPLQLGTGSQKKQLQSAVRPLTSENDSAAAQLLNALFRHRDAADLGLGVGL